MNLNQKAEKFTPEESLFGALVRIAELKEECDAHGRRIEQLNAVLERANTALAQQADDLLAYQDYYGTSVAQVRHLQGCEKCETYNLATDVYTEHCPDYPTE